MKKVIIDFVILSIAGIFFWGCGTEPSEDTEAPSVSITYPANGYTTTGSVNITVEATDNETISKVELIIDGVLKSTDTSSPYSFNVDFTTYSEGAHNVVAKAYDSSNNSTVSSTITINYGHATDTEAPSVSISSPSSGTTTSGSATFTVQATDNDQIGRVELFVDGVLKGTDNTAPYSFTIDFTSYSEGAHTVTAKAYDRSDNSTISAAITINYLYDFAPSGNGKIRVAITHYIEDETLDELSWGDPVFLIGCIYAGDTTVVESSEFTDMRELTNPFHYDFDLPDNAVNLQIFITVWDSDVTDYEQVDYTPETGFAYIWSLSTKENLPFSGTYDGSDDGHASEPDCELSINITIVY